MTKYTIALCAFLMSGAAMADSPEVDISGECPGEVSIDIISLEPYSTVTVIYGEPAEDGDGGEIPRGHCEGVETELESGARGDDLSDLDGDGEIHHVATLSDGHCGVAFHMLDVDNCEISDLAYVPDSDDEGDTSTDIYDYYTTPTDYYDLYEYYYDAYGTTYVTYYEDLYDAYYEEYDAYYDEGTVYEYYPGYGY